MNDFLVLVIFEFEILVVVDFIFIAKAFAAKISSVKREYLIVIIFPSFMALSK